MELWQRIKTNPDILMGQPVIAGTNLSVQFILSLLAKGKSDEEIMREYPNVTKEYIRACQLWG